MCKVVDLEKADQKKPQQPKKDVFHDDGTVDQNPFDDDDGDDDSAGDCDRSESTKKEIIAERESFAVHLSKVFVLVVITLAAFLVGYFTSMYLTEQQGVKFQSEFDEVADEIISITHIRYQGILDNLESVGVSLTSQARSTNSKFPFVRFPDFQVQGVLFNQITGASMLSIHPFVRDEDRDGWEIFSVFSQDWLADGHYYDEHAHPRLYSREYFNATDGPDSDKSAKSWNVTGIIPSIWTPDANGSVIPLPAHASELYAPVWQQAPAADYMPNTNKDLLSDVKFKEAIRVLINTTYPVMTKVDNASYLTDNFDRRFVNEEQKDSPHVYILKPMFDSLYKTRELVGFFSSLIRLDKFFTNVLPETEESVVLVLHGNCNDNVAYSFQINGHETEFLGPGVLRDFRFNSMERNFTIAPPDLMEATNDQTFCQHDVRVYPTKAFRDKYYTNLPFFYGMAVASCFVAASLVFLIYDFNVQRRQITVMNSAERTSAIVSNLFPATVRHRMMEELRISETRTLEESDSSGKIQNSFFERRKALSSFPSGGDLTPGTSETIFGSKPIADLFPSVTIMFADLAGFTKWSSTREPRDVFTLLETIYAAFDGIAKRRRVFKVETIGDCYVAVCGLPVARDDHAVVMARFSSECRVKMNALTSHLKEVLGADTADLAMRIGLHSGPVTGGVLRGDKGRFQLFGDSMNTTARIESTGEKNRIHISQETSDLLAQAGKQHWVVMRKDKVVAKGKGELQTYWLQIKSSVASVSEHSHSARSQRTGSLKSDDDKPMIPDYGSNVGLEIF